MKSHRREVAVPTQASARGVDEEDVVLLGHDLVILDADKQEVARVSHEGRLDLDRVRLDSQGLELFDLDHNSAIVASTQRMGLDSSANPPPEARTAEGPLPQVPVSDATLRVGASGNYGRIQVHDREDRRVIDVLGYDASLSVGAAGNGGDIIVQDGEARHVVTLTGSTATVAVGAEGNEGDVVIRSNEGRDAIRLNGGKGALTLGVEGNEGDLRVLDPDGRESLRVDGETATVTVGCPDRPGELIVRDDVGREVLRMDGEQATLVVGAAAHEGDIIVRDAFGADRIQLNGSTGDIKLLGADLAEDFDTSTDVSPGAVVVAVGPDEVTESTAAYDRRVVGVASGAGDLQPALRLATRPGDHRTPVALVGRVYCRADAGSGAIEIGDLLTTSNTPGHAMRVDDPSRAAGTVIGKALAPLAAGTGLVPVLLMLR